MKLKHYTCGMLLAISMAVVIVVPSVEAPVDPTTEDFSAVGPLLDKLADLCHDEFSTTRHRLLIDQSGTVTGCEERAPKVAAK